MVREEQTKDWLREVEKDRLVRLALTGQKGGARLYCQLLALLGRQLVAWGHRLQERYGAAMGGSRVVESSPQLGGR